MIPTNENNFVRIVKLRICNDFSITTINENHIEDTRNLTTAYILMYKLISRFDQAVELWIYLLP